MEDALIRTAWIPLLLLLAVSGTAAGEAGDTIRAAADSVREAHAAGDTKRVAALAARDHPDPWLVADALAADGASDIALAFARAAPRKDVEALPDYLRGAPKPAAQLADREALDRARSLLAAGEFEAALAAIDGRPAVAATITAVRIQHLRGDLLERLQRTGESANAFAASAETAHALGWGAQESESLYRAGVAYWIDYAWTDVIRTFERRLEVETGLGSDTGRGRAHYGLATAYYAQDRPAEARTHLEQAHACAKDTGDHEYVAKSLGLEARLRARNYDPEGCLDLSRQALAAFDRIDGAGLATRFQPDAARVAESRARLLLNCAVFETELSAIDAARAYIRKAQRLAEQTADTRLTALCAVQSHLIDGAWHDLGHEDLEALAAYEQALEACKHAGNARLYARTFSSLGDLYRRLGNPEQGLKYVKQALMLLENRSAPAAVGRARLAAGLLELRIGRTNEALAHVQAAVEGARAAGDLRLEVDALARLAEVYHARGEYGRARQALQEALDDEVALGRPGTRGMVLVKLGQLHASLRNWDEAGLAVDEALEVMDPIRDAATVGAARSLSARLLSMQGERDEAYAELDKLLAEQTARGDKAGRAITLDSLASIRFAQRRYRDALRLREQALAGYEETNQLQRTSLARVQRGRDRFWAGDGDTAIEELTKAYDDARESHSALVERWAASSLADASFQRKDYPETIRWARAALEAMDRVGLDLTDEEAARLREGFAGFHQLGAAAALRSKRAEDLYYFMERGRAAALLAALGGRRALYEAAVPARMRRAEEHARAVEADAQLAVAKARATNKLKATREAKQALRLASRKRQQVLEAIERHAKGQADLVYLSVTPLDEVRAGLAKHDALVLYAEVLDRYAALVVTPKGTRIVDLGEMGAVTEAVAALLDADEEARVNPSAVGAVRKRLLAPLELAQDTRRLLISPDGHLSFVPFGLIAEKHEVALLPSGTARGVLRMVDVSGAEQVLAMGDPVYTSKGKLGATGFVLRAGGLDRLPGTADEVRTIGDEVYVREEASETRFRDVVSRDRPWRAVHLACHGLVDPERPTLCALALTADKTHDGFLTAMDVLRLPVPAEMVVLSACDTGKGRVFAGEGMLGLTRAFMHAGAPRVVVSLWKVPDKPTSALMKKFYELWNPKGGKRGLSAAAALRQAQDYIRSQKKWAHPKNWAAWVLWGLPD